MGKWCIMSVFSRKRAILAVALVACSGAAWTAPGVVVDIPPPRPITKTTPAPKPVPIDLLAKHDAAFLAYQECGSAISREAHRTEQLVTEFARTWAKSCLAEELAWKRQEIAILKFRGDPHPRESVELFARELRAKKVEQYREHKEFNEQLRETCGPDFRLCQD
jgi:hypothetical protein